MNIFRLNFLMVFLVINFVVFEILRFLYICWKFLMVLFWFKECLNFLNYKLLNSYFLVCLFICLVIIFFLVVSLDEYFCSLFGYKILMLFFLWLFVVLCLLKLCDLVRWYRYKIVCCWYYIKKYFYFVYVLYNIYEFFYFYYFVFLNVGKYN